MDLLDQKGRRPCLCRRRREPPQLPFELLFPFPHLRQLVGEIGEGTFDVVSKHVQNIPDGLGLQNLVLKLIEQLFRERYVKPVLCGASGGSTLMQ